MSVKRRGGSYLEPSGGQLPAMHLLYVAAALCKGGPGGPCCRLWPVL